MKVFGVLAGLLLLFISIHGLEDLSVNCSDLWLQVRIRRIPFVDNMPPQPYELYLGTGCPVSRVLPNFFEFIYTLTSCGIRKYDRPWGILIESSISYEPVFLNIRGTTPVSCVVQRNFCTERTRQKCPWVQKKFSFTFGQKEVQTNSSASGERTQAPGGTETSTSSQVENLGTFLGVSDGTKCLQEKTLLECEGDPKNCLNDL